MQTKTAIGAIVFLYGALGVAIAPASADAPTPAPTSHELPAATFHATFATRLKAVQTELAAALAKLDVHLQASGPDNARAWKQYLAWDTIAQCLQGDAAVEPDQLFEVIDRYRAAQSGLERSEFSAVRKALQHFAHLIAESDQEQFERTYNEQVETIRQLWPVVIDHTASAEQRFSLAQAQRWLSQHQQAQPLTAHLAERHAQPNLYATFSSRLATAVMGESIQTVEPLHDNILGVSIRGMVDLRGRTTIAFRHDPRRMSFDVLMQACAASNSVGCKHPVTLFVTGTTSVESRKPMHMTAQGLNADPATACCATNTSINGIATKRRIVERIAWRQSARQKSTAEAIGSRHAEQKTAARMDEKAARQIAETNASFREHWLDLFARRADQPPEMHFSSGDNQGQVAMRIAADDQLASSSPPPALSGTHDLALRLDESAIRNLAEVYLGGMVLTDRDVDRQLNSAGITPPPELALGPDAEPWSMTYARQTPVRLEISPGRVRVALRGESFERGEQSLRDLVEISVVYQHDADGREWTREGEVNVDFLNRSRLTASLIGFKSFLRRKYSALFAERFSLDRLPAIGGLGQVGPLELDELRTSAGWLALSARLSSPLPERIAATASPSGMGR